MRTRTTHRSVALALTSAVILAACSGGTGSSDDGASDTGSDTAETEVRLVTHDSFDLSEELLDTFTETTGYDLLISAPGDAGALVNQLILTKDSPLGDVVYGIDNAFAARAANAGILEDYDSPDLPDDAEQYLIDETSALTPIDVGDVCLNVDHEWFTANDIPEPASFDDLLEPAYKDLTVVSNPAQSSPGLAFLLATISVYGDDWSTFWQDLMDNGAKVAGSWSDVYYTDFTTAGGSRPIALSYSTSPAVTVPEGGTESTTGSLLDTCFRQIEYAGVLTDANNPDGARAFIDFLLSDEVQAAIPESLYMYPVTGVDLPEEWVAHAPLSDSPHQVDPADIEANLDDWLRTWQDDVIG